MDHNHTTSALITVARATKPNWEIEGSMYTRELAMSIALEPHALRFMGGLDSIGRERLRWSDVLQGGGDHCSMGGDGCNVVLRADRPQPERVVAHGCKRWELLGCHAHKCKNG